MIGTEETRATLQLVRHGNRHPEVECLCVQATEFGFCDPNHFQRVVANHDCLADQVVVATELVLPGGVAKDNNRGRSCRRAVFRYTCPTRKRSHARHAEVVRRYQFAEKRPALNASEDWSGGRYLGKHRVTISEALIFRPRERVRCSTPVSP